MARKFVTLLLDGKFESAAKKFDDKMREASPPDKLEEAWNMTVCEAGPFREQLGTRTEQIDIYDIVFVTCEFEETLIDIKIVFNKKKEISGLFFLPGLSQDLEKELTIVSEKFIKLLDDGKFQEGAGNFDKTMTEELTPEMLQEAWKALIAQLGPFKGTINSRAEKEGKYNIIFITCELEKGAVDIKLVFNNKQQISGLFFLPVQSVSYEPPDYISKESFTEEEIMTGCEEWLLPGTLTIPDGDGPFPAVVLVHGSGPNDRDETIGPNKPFKDLAWGLASRGIAVLRYEKRTKEHGTKMASMEKELTVKEETVDDALAAVLQLKDMDKIDKNKIFVIGHSLGGTVIPLIGLGDEDIAGLIILAGAARPLEDLMIEQYEYIFSLDGNIDETEEEKLEKVREGVSLIKSDGLAETDRVILGAGANYWLYLRDYEPAEEAKGLKMPVLILQGERDYQVTMDDFEKWEDALKEKDDVEFKVYPELNHLFISGKGKSTPDEYQMAGHVAKYVIEDISNWIKKKK